VARGAPSDWDGRVNYMVPAEVARARWEGAAIDDLRGDLSAMEFTLRFTLSNPHLDTTIVGTRNPEHLRATVEAAMRGPLPDGLVAEAKRRLAEAGAVPQ
jgi:aryl-alcohol dehydrogenase-like predicted oxidoreductase